MQKLNLPSYQFKIKNSENTQLIFDIIRKKYVVLTPEEWVRQNFIHFLIQEKKYPISLIAIEKQFKINNLIKRFDILIFNKSGLPLIIVECKATSVKLTQETFDQIARYNLNYEADYLIVTNGLSHYTCSTDVKNKSYNFLTSIPEYK